MKHVIFLIALLFATLCAAQDYSFEHFETIKHLNKDRNGNIYLVTDYSICKFRGSENKGDCYYVEDKIDNSIIASEGNFFISQNNTLKEYIGFEEVNRMTIEESITKLAYFNNHLIIGTSGDGAYVYSNKTLNSILKDVFVNDIRSADNRLYVVTDNELIVYDSGFNTIASKSFKQIIDQVVVFEGSIVLLTNTSEVIFLNKALEISKNYSSNNHQIEKLFQIDNTLFALDDTGILKWHNDDFHLKKEIKNPVKHSVAAQTVLLSAYSNKVYIYNLLTTAYDITNTFSIFAEGDRFWLGREGEISLFNDGKIEKQIKLPLAYKNTFISSMVITNDRIYAGTMGNGILLIDKITGKYLGGLDYENSSKTHQNIIQMDIKNNLLWIGYLNGLEVLDLNTNQIISDHSPLLKNNYLYQFYAIDNNEFFLCTSDAGLIYQNNGQTKSYLDGKTIYGIEEFNTDYILSVEDEGLFLLNDTLVKLSDKFYLNSSNIYNMLTTTHKMLVGHNNGVDVASISENEVNYLTYSKNLGQPQLNSNAVGTTKLLMSFENGIVEFDKTLLNIDVNKNLTLQPPLVFDIPVRDSTATYSYDKNTWTFNYSTVNLSSPNTTYYKYRLRPLEDNWISTTKETTTYYNLPSNAYTFEVSSGNDINFIPSNIKSYTFKIRKPFWEHYLFWLFSIALLVVLIYTFLKYRENKIKKREVLRTKQLEFEYQKLKDQVNPHFLFNSFNSIIGVTEDNPKQGVIALEKLSNLYRHILEYEKAELIELSEELAFTQHYFEIHKLRFQNLIELNISNELRPEGKLIIPFSLQLNVENAIKHNIINSKNKLRIDIFEEDDYIVVSNTLNEKKNNSNSTGLGLQNLINRHEMKLKKKPIVVKTATAFTVKIPFIYG